MDHIQRPELLECVGSYRLLHLIGRGASTEVHLARRSDRPGLYALKRLRIDRADDLDAIEAHNDEIRLGACMRHPNLARAIHAGQSGGRPWMAMHYVDGPSMGHLLQATEVQASTLPWRAVASIGVGLADALHATHHTFDKDGRPLHVVHRDLSPANVLISTHGRVSVADFGLARFIGRRSATDAGRIRGSLVWMAPEQLLAKPLDARTDVFALGLLLYQLAARQHPFARGTAGETARAILRSDRVPLLQLRPDLPRAFADVIEGCLELDPSRRPHRARAVRAALRALLGPSNEHEAWVRRTVVDHFVWNQHDDEDVRPWHAAKRRQTRPSASWYDPATAVTIPPTGRRWRQTYPSTSPYAR